MQLISDYMRDERSLRLLNELTRKTFGFDFDGWVKGGYFEGDYIPYSLVEDGKMISNVSANRMRFMQNGKVKNYIQIGTVMTDESRRKQGLAAELMKHVTGIYEKECDGIYLFGALSAYGFYQKNGFQILNQYRYTVKEEFCIRDNGKEPFKPVSEMGGEIREKYLDLVRNSAPHSPFEQINKYGLQLFYTSGLDNVFYAEDIGCFIVLEEDDGIVLQSELSKEKTALSDVLKRIDLNGAKCRLGFTPLDEDNDKCVAELYDGADDYRLFYRGEELLAIEKDRLYFPDLSHA
ncbi:MAG: GNAT family N-acetyltransferase [Ruminococcaceae bacterium]|nr:GNAT family N-acetyltransferase [Oscillospiraceae bacterium]